MAGAPTESKKPREFRIPAEIANDGRLSDRAVRLYLILLDCEREGIATIGYPRMAERLKCHRDTAMGTMKELLASSHVRKKEKGKQHVPNVYEIVAKPGRPAMRRSFGGKRDVYPTFMGLNSEGKEIWRRPGCAPEVR